MEKLLWKNLNDDDTTKSVYPSMMFFLYVLLLFPVSVAHVERLSSNMKLIKIRLRTQLSQVHLDQLLRIATESPKEDFSDNLMKTLSMRLKIEIQN